MKNKFVPFLVIFNLLLAIFVFYFVFLDNDDYDYKGRFIPKPINYQKLAVQRIKRILEESPQEVNIVMLGNSITQGGKDWNKKLGRNDVRNSGQGGFTTGQMLWLLDTCVIQAKPKICFMLAGINDFTLEIPFKQVYKNYIEILDRLKKAGIKPIVQSTLYQSNNSENNKHVKALNSLLRKYCKKNNIDYIDLNRLLSDKNGLKKKYTSDGTHLTKEGYKVWTGKLKVYLKGKGL